MSLQQYVEQIEELLWAGSIEGMEVLKLHQVLQAYLGGEVSGAVVQQQIDWNDRDKLQQWIDKHLPPLFDE